MHNELLAAWKAIEKLDTDVNILLLEVRAIRKSIRKLTRQRGEEGAFADVVLEFFVETGWSRRQLAKVAGVTEATLRRGMTGEHVSPEVEAKVKKVIDQELGRL